MNPHAYEKLIIDRIKDQCGLFETGGFLCTVAPVLDVLGHRELHKLLPAVFVELPDAEAPDKVGRKLVEDQPWSVILVVPKSHPKTNQPYTGEDIGSMIEAVVKSLLPPWKPVNDGNYVMDYHGRSVAYNQRGWVEVPIRFVCKAEILFLTPQR